MFNVIESREFFGEEKALAMNCEAKGWVRCYMFFEDVVECANNAQVSGMEQMDFKGHKTLH